MITIKPTKRGFLRGEFRDRYDNECSIQESSLAFESCLWLGQDECAHHHVTGDCMARMHLTREMAKDLLPLLRHFVKTGRLPVSKPRARSVQR